MRIIYIVSLFISILNITLAQSWQKLGDTLYGKKTNQLIGYAVALSSHGETLTVGGSLPNSNDGLVRVFTFNGTNWEQIGKDIPNSKSVSISTVPVSELSIDSTIAIGYPKHRANGNNSGRTKFYLYMNGKWTNVNCDIDGEFEGDLWGSAGAFAANTPIIAIGAPQNDGNGNNSGHVRIYKFVNGTWIQIGQDLDGESENDLFGSAISISSDGLRVAIGAPYNDGNGENAGKVRIYKFVNGTWIQIGHDIVGLSDGDKFGQVLSLSSDGNTIAIGAPSCDEHGEESGQVRIFKYDEYSWIQQGNTLNGKFSGDKFGQSISISSDGLTIAIGAPLNDDNGTNSGTVKLYEFNGRDWYQIGNDLNGNVNDHFGQSVSLSSDGSRIAVGAPYSEMNGVKSGYTKVFVYSNNVNVYENDGVPKSLTVFPAYPNPFNPTTTITYGLEESCNISIEIYNLSGNLITTLLNKEQQQGWYSIEWNGTDQNNNQVPAGIYFSRITAKNITKTSKLMLLK